MPDIFQEDIQTYKTLQTQRHTKYGTDDIQATFAIAKEIGI